MANSNTDYPVALTLDEAIKTCLNLRAFDICLCREILDGKNVTANLGMMSVNEAVHNTIFDQIEDICGDSPYSLAYLMYQEELKKYLTKMAELLEEAREEYNEE